MEIRVVAFLGIPLTLAGAVVVLASPATRPATGPSSAPSSAPASSPSTAAARTVWDGVYTNDQLDRGKKGYNALCARCHGDNLLGNDDAPALVGKVFLEKWSGQTVWALVDLTQKQMPTDGPGKLTRKQCTDVVAYVLNANSFPAGKSELMADPDSLKGILIQAKK